MTAFLRNGFIVLLACVCFVWNDAGGEPRVQPQKVPAYILEGLKQYETNGYESAVKAWLKGSHLEQATQMASRIQFFRNIERLYGKYLSYDILNLKETGTSQMTYVRFNFERQKGYARFISLRKNGAWVLGDLDLHTQQQLPAGP